MYVTATSPRFSRGRSTPATLAIVRLRSSFERRLCRRNPSWGRHRRGPSRPPPTLSLTLLVPRVFADDAGDALPLDDLAVLAPRLHRRSNFHGSPYLNR